MMSGSHNKSTQPLHIAFFSPFPPERSGISDYSSELLPYLANYVDITLFSADPSKVDSTLSEQFPIHPIENYPEKRWQYDIPLYQMGNSAHHEAIYRMFLRYPGFVTLHDYSLYHFITQRTLGQQRVGDYMREVGYSLGIEGIEQVRQSRSGTGGESLHTIPFNKRLLDLSLGTVVHSHYAQNLIRTQKPEATVKVISQHMTALDETSRRHYLSWPQDAVIFASVGQVTSVKQIDFALRAFKKLRERNPDIYYLIVGEEMEDIDLTDMIRGLELTDSVQHIGYVADKQEFVDWIYTADVIINLRYPTMGETSATALRALASGRALILFDHGWYSELPDSVCIKVPPLDEDALFLAMSQLVQYPQKRQQPGENGKKYIHDQHRPELTARAYADFIHQQLTRINKYGN